MIVYVIDKTCSEIMENRNSSVVKASDLGPKLSVGSISLQSLLEVYFYFSFQLRTKLVIRLFKK